MVIDAARETIARHQLLERGDSVLVAVSGGVDSVVLLDVLRVTADEFGIFLAVAHLNHGWRGADSDGDAAFVEALARDAGLRIVSERLGDEAVARYAGLGREGAAREARRAFLERAATAVGADRIALGHTATDRAETILFNLARGAGSDGFAGIGPSSGPFVRPLIEIERADVLAYAEARGLTWREDATNADPSFARNRIRHRILPELERINPRTVDAVCRGGDLAGEAKAIAAFLVDRVWPEVCTAEEPGRLRFDRSALAGLPDAVRRLVLREGFRRVRGDLSGIERRHVDAVAGLTVSGSGHRSLDLPRLHVRGDGDAVVLASESPTAEGNWESDVELGRTRFPARGFGLDLRLVERDDDRATVEPSDRSAEVADADRVAFPLTVRNRRRGDRFTPLGMDRPVRLKDFLMNERVPYFERDDVPLLCDRDKILWIAGVRLSNEIRVTEETNRLLVMRWEAGAT